MGNPETIGERAAEGKSEDDDRRKEPRHPCQGFAEVVVADACFLFRGHIRDISQTGCYIRSRATLRLERGTEVDLLFTIRVDQFKLPARVMSVRPGSGAGFEFIEGNPEMRARLARLIKILSTLVPAGECAIERVPAEIAAERQVGNLW